MEPKTIIIKKYENRRLYDTTNSRYVNLDEVAKLLQNGERVQVVDAATGADITRLILTQIVVEDAKDPDSNFPLNVLRQMVIASGRASQESALKYMKAMLDMYQNTYQVVAPPLSPFEFIHGKDEAIGAATNSQPVAPEDRSRTRRAENPRRDDVDDLKRKVAELEMLVSTLAPRKAPKKKKATLRSRPGRKS
jgi:polyhydroxyalkanoate synthesis repressor PhaR